MGIAVLDRPGVRSEEPLCYRTDPGSSVELADRPGTPAGRPAARPASRRRCGCPGRVAWMRGPAMSLPRPGGQVPAGSGDAGTSRDAGRASAGGPRAGFALLLSLSMAQFMVV